MDDTIAGTPIDQSRASADFDGEESAQKSSLAKDAGGPVTQEEDPVLPLSHEVEAEDNGERQQELRRRNPDRESSGGSTNTSPSRKLGLRTAAPQEEDRRTLLSDDQLGEDEDNLPRSGMGNLEVETRDCITQRKVSPCLNRVRRRAMTAGLVSGIMIAGAVTSIIVLSHLINTHRPILCPKAEQPTEYTHRQLACKHINDALIKLDFKAAHLDTEDKITRDVIMNLTNELEAIADQSNCTSCRVRGRPLFVGNFVNKTILMIDTISEDIEAMFEFPELIGPIYSLDVDWKQRTLFFLSAASSYDGHSAVIHSVSLDSCDKKPSLVYSRAALGDIAVDVINKFIFFFVATKYDHLWLKDFHLVRIHYEPNEETIIHNFTTINNHYNDDVAADTLVADPVTSSLYIARCYAGFIGRCDYNGGCYVLTDSYNNTMKVAFPNRVSGMALDMNERVLYWAEFTHDVAWTLNLHVYHLNTGLSQVMKILTTDDAQLRMGSLVVRNDYLYLAAQHESNAICLYEHGNITRVSKTGGQLESFGLPLFEETTFCVFIEHRLA